MKSILMAVVALALSMPSDRLWGREDGCKRSNDPSFTAQQRELITVAKKHLEALEKRALDACFEVISGRDGHVFVVVTRVAGYRGGKPLFQPGGHTGVEFDRNNKIVRIHGGA